MESLFYPWGLNLAVITFLMICGWIISLIYRNVTIVDSLWGLGFVVIVWTTFFMAPGFLMRKLLIAILVTLWGLRLSIYLSIRNWGAGEDKRYTSWREESGDRFWIESLFKVFLIQALFLFIISLMIQKGQISTAPNLLTALDILGIALWTVGFLFEAVGDWQLYRFKSDPANKGKVLDQGLWTYTRHPNYFGEILIWWGIFFITLSAPKSFWTIISPILITLVLIKMTGVKLTEETILKTRPLYRDYMKQTNALFPWFPKKEGN